MVVMLLVLCVARINIVVSSFGFLLLFQLEILFLRRYLKNLCMEDRVVNRFQFSPFLANRPQIEFEHEAAVLKRKREGENGAGVPLDDAV